MDSSGGRPEAGERTSGMILTHVAWGSAFALADTELLKAKPIFAGGPIKDRA